MFSDRKVLLSGYGWVCIAISLVIALGVAVFSTTAQSRQRSTDRNNPVPLTSSILSDSLQEKDGAPYYYSVTAGPGEIVFSLQVSTQGAQSYLELAVFDDSDRLLLKLEATSTSKGGNPNPLILAQRQPLLLRIKGAKYNAFGNYQLSLRGNLSITPASSPQLGNSLNPPTTTKDSKPPRIVITSPDTARGQGVKADKILVAGQVTDESGVGEVAVLGQPVRFDAAGRFSTEVPLQSGENQIVATAADIYGNRAQETFIIRRDLTFAGGASAALADGRYYALLIGVEEYQDKRIPRLENPLKDSQQLARVLITRYTFDKDRITLLANPGRREMLKAFKDLKGKLAVSDFLLIFYAGHGEWNPDKEQGYWLPSDAEFDSSSQWFSNSDLRDEVKGIKASHILLISDACFSGGLFKERNLPKEAPVAIQEILKLHSRKAITSGALKTVPDKSVFIEHLLKRLEDNQDDFLPALSLFANLREAVTNNSPNRQTPLYGTIQGAGDEGGDFIFKRRR